MTSHDRLQQKMLELCYGLLDGDEANELRVAIQEDSRVAEAWINAQRMAGRFAEAARVTAEVDLPSIEILTEDRVRLIDNGPRALRIANGLIGVLAVAASIGLILVGWRFVQKSPVEPSGAIAVKVARLRTHEHGSQNQFRITTTRLASGSMKLKQPLATLALLAVEVRSGPAVLYRSQLSTDEQGTTLVAVPDRIMVPKGAQMVVTAKPGQSDLKGSSLSIPLEPTRCLTYLKVDRPMYRPGETVYFRSLTLERHSLNGELDLPIRFELLDPSGAVVPNAFVEGVTQRGVGNGAFPLPQSIAGGQYTLVAKSLDSFFPEERCEFQVQAYRVPQLRKVLEFRRRSYGPGDHVEADFSALRAEGGPVANGLIRMTAMVDGTVVSQLTLHTATDGSCLLSFDLPDQIVDGKGQLSVSVDDGGVQESIAKTIPITLGRVEVEFYPEGGYLVAGLKNRVYFSARNNVGKPLHLAGEIIDEVGNQVAKIETLRDGMGRFDFTPEASHRYVLKVTTPVDVTNSPELPAVTADYPVLSTGTSVFGVDEPLVFTLRSMQKRSVVVSAFCRGALVGTERFQLSPGEQICRLPVKAADGVVRLTVFEGGVPQKPLVERLVFRRASKKLSVRIVDSNANAARSPGDKLRLTLQVVDEHDQPAAAVLGVAVTDDSALGLAEHQRPNLSTHFLLASEIRKPEDLEHANFYLSDTPDAADSLDLLLGTQGWRRFVDHPTDTKATTLPEQLARLVELDGRPSATLQETSNAGTIEKLWQRYQVARESVRQRLYADLRLLCIIPLLMLLILVFRRSGSHWRSSACNFIAMVLSSSTLISMIGCGPSSGTVQLAPSATPQQSAEEGFRLRNRRVAAEEFLEPADALMNHAVIANDQETAERKDVALLDFNNLPAGLDAGREDKFLGSRAGFDGGHWRTMLGNGLAKEAADAILAQLRFPVREYSHQHAWRDDGVRSDFTETVYWQPLLLTDASGQATIRFDLSDSVTTFRVLVDAHANGGRIGTGDAEVVSKLPFQLEPQLPLAVTVGDRIDLPVAVINTQDSNLPVQLELEPGVMLKALSDTTFSVVLTSGERSRQYFPLMVSHCDVESKCEIRVRGSAGTEGKRFIDEVRRSFDVAPAGYPQRQTLAGVLRGTERLQLPIPETYIHGSLAVTLRAYPSPLADILSGVESILQEPHGCFEQTSATNYPNAMALQYLRQHGIANAAMAQRASGMLDRGYQKLVSFECKQLGYEWFGNDPGHEALSAFGLMQFADMSQLMPIQSEVLSRTKAWLLARRDGKGGFLRNPRHLHVWSVDQAVVNAYVLWALTESETIMGRSAVAQTELEAELKHGYNVANDSDDPYLMALLAAALLNADRSSEGTDLLKKLANYQTADGSFIGKASVVQSGGISLKVESTAIAAIALLKRAEFRDRATAAVRWLSANRQGSGGFGSTQATVLALKALVTFAQQMVPPTESSGKLVVRSNGEKIATASLPADPRSGTTIELTGLATKLKHPANSHALELVLEGMKELPYSVDVAFSLETPPSDSACPLRLTTNLNGKFDENGSVPVGTPLRVGCSLDNLSTNGLSMTVAVIGLPGGVEPHAEELNELRDAGQFDFYELRPREVILYWRGIEPRGTKRIEFTVAANIPGQYTAPASRAYLYYTAEQKFWTEPLRAEIQMSQTRR